MYFDTFRIQITNPIIINYEQVLTVSLTGLNLHIIAPSRIIFSSGRR